MCLRLGWGIPLLEPKKAQDGLRGFLVLFWASLDLLGALGKPFPVVQASFRVWERLHCLQGSEGRDLNTLRPLGLKTLRAPHPWLESLLQPKRNATLFNEILSVIKFFSKSICQKILLTILTQEH